MLSYIPPDCSSCAGLLYRKIAFFGKKPVVDSLIPRATGPLRFPLTRWFICILRLEDACFFLPGVFNTRQT